MSATGSYRRLSRFALIGIASTLIYAVCAFLLSALPTVAMPAASASVAAYVIAAMFSYAGHKYVTFVSPGAHAFEVLRFSLLTASGLGLSWLLPLILVEGLGAPPVLSIAIICVVVPAINYFVLARWVFTSGRKMRATS
ncbi:MAG: GtrA family protein [Mesorhizobium sp.]|uniref:GtrA family protein n=1 Tax=Mesorhizobium sp. TaxID=1871066 RepID=UPI001226CE72|nr:GtrA family protein [Mesorhizobium sp.]TIT00136.1 MAG: GtrA family protein [Mesorhizobium sp.]TIT52838.1 MAG: GtrA family protein [Mesorhizobium sp.]